MVDFKELWEITREYGVCPYCSQEIYLDEWDKHQLEEHNKEI